MLATAAHSIAVYHMGTARPRLADTEQEEEKEEEQEGERLPPWWPQVDGAQNGHL